jgi:hypothetical protein
MHQSIIANLWNNFGIRDSYSETTIQTILLVCTWFLTLLWNNQPNNASVTSPMRDYVRLFPIRLTLQHFSIFTDHLDLTAPKYLNHYWLNIERKSPELEEFNYTGAEPLFSRSKWWPLRSAIVAKWQRQFSEPQSSVIIISIRKNEGQANLSGVNNGN